jgi:hypothetical protein
MPFLSKSQLSSSSLPFPELQEKEAEHPSYLQRVHEEALADSFKSLANRICIFYKNQKPGDKPPLFAFDPCAFHYHRYGQQKFLRLKDIVGSPEEAEAYYKKRFEEAFPDFPVELKRRHGSDYAYSVVIQFLDV